jgi:hypothetical protein
MSSPAIKVRYYQDAASGLPHIRGHGITESEVEDVLRRAGEDRGGYDGARIAIGQTRAGRYVRVIYVTDEDGGVFVLTAYELSGRPLRAYRRRMKRRNI